MLNAIALLIPVLMLLVFAEWYISYKRQDNRYTAGNTIMNITIGAIDQICSLAHFALLYIVMQFVFTHFRWITNDNNWYQWVGGYLAVDFLSYWYHRFSHRVNILWAGHITHHSSEFLNFTNGFRTSIFQGINRIFFWAFLPVFGFDPVVLVLILKISGLYDFLLHTEYIPKLGILEKFLITPSLHRVHHGKNDIYIDKNYGSTLLIWDQLFGTYQPETEPVKYGIKSPYTDNNPLMAIGYYYRYIWQAIKATPRFSDKVKMIFMPPDWKPKTERAIEVQTDTPSAPLTLQLKRYAAFQIITCTSALTVMLVYKDFIYTWEIILFSAIGLITMINNTMVFNGNVQANFVRHESLRLCFAALLVFTALLFYPKLYFLPVLLYLTVSLLFIGTGQLNMREGDEELNNVDAEVSESSQEKLV